METSEKVTRGPTQEESELSKPDWYGYKNGAVVVGGDYQGLGILRSLGRQGVPVCVVDDERSISRFSRYCTHFEKLPDLRGERNTVDSLLEIGTRLNLHGWVLYPTREELVAAFSRNRTELAEVFRVPTADWDVVKWAWDKRNLPTGSGARHTYAHD
jgi:D-aspartate ligase